MNLPTPGELGLPQANWRPVQMYALQLMATRHEPVLCLQGPPGTGKTLVGMAWARMQQRRLLYTCVTKDLQAQFVRSFPGLAKEVRGRDNYPTLRRELWPEVTCDDCDLHGTRCTWCAEPAECPYRVAKAEARGAESAALNLAYWLRVANGPRAEFVVPGRETRCWHCERDLDASFPVCSACGWYRCSCGHCAEGCEGGETRQSWVLCVDEADELRGVLEGHISVEVPRYWLDRLYIPEPRFQTANVTHQRQEWLPWFEFAGKRLSEEADKAIEQAASLHGVAKAKRLRTARRLNDVVASLDRVYRDVADNPDSWVRGKGAVWHPVDVSRYAPDLVWKHTDRALLMSATLPESHEEREMFCHRLGLDPTQVGWIDLPCTFPVENRRMYLWPAAKVTYKTKDTAWPKLVASMDMILDAYPERALVHTHSYELQRYVLEHTRHLGRTVAYAQASGREEALAKAAAQEGSVLVAPSLTRGVSLDGDLCRCVIVLKIPWPSLDDPLVKAQYRLPDGKLWYESEAARTFIQAVGRANRSETDWADIWILDAEFNRLWWRLYQWVREGVITDPSQAVARLRQKLEGSH